MVLAEAVVAAKDVRLQPVVDSSRELAARAVVLVAEAEGDPLELLSGDVLPASTTRFQIG